MSTTSHIESYGTKSCLSVDMIEALFTAFALRRFEKNSEACLLSISSSSNKLDHSSSGWCDRSRYKHEPSRCYGSISSRQASFLPGEALLPRDAIDCPAVGHQICMIYNTDPDGIASRVADKASGALLWTDANGNYNVSELKPSSDWTRRECAVGGGRYNQKTAKSFVSIPSTRGFGSRETACEPCAVSLKRFAEMLHKACTNATIKRKSDERLYATLHGASTRPEYPYDFDVPLLRAEYLHDKSHKETMTGPCTVPKCKMSLSSVISAPTRQSRKRTRKHSA